MRSPCFETIKLLLTITRESPHTASKTQSSQKKKEEEEEAIFKKKKCSLGPYGTHRPSEEMKIEI